MAENEVEEILDSLLPEAEETQPETKDSDPASPEESPSAVLEQRLHDTQAAFHELSEKNAHMQGQLDAISSQEQPPDPVDLDKLKEQFREDPGSVVEYMADREKSLRQELASVIVERDQRLDQTIQRADPAFDLIQQKIKILKQDPDFTGFEDKQLAVIARKSLKKVTRVPGAAGGRAAETTQPTTTEVEVPEAAYAALIQGSGYTVEEKKDGD